MDELISVLSDSGGNDLYVQQKKEFLDNRIIVFNQEIDDNAVEDLCLHILKWNMEDIDIPIEKRKKIKIYLSSVGGDTFVTRNVVDVIMTSKTPVMGVGLSLVASGAYHIYLACSERISWPRSCYLQHDGNISVSNSSKKAADTFNFLNALDENAKEFILSRTNMTSEFYDKIYETEYWMTAQRAKELGVVQKIIGEDCDIDYIF